MDNCPDVFHGLSLCPRRARDFRYLASRHKLIFFRSDIASYPSARQVQRYLCDYSQHFGLMPHVRLGNEVIGATFDKVTEKWTIESRSRSGQAREEVFDRLVLATGINSLPHIPDIEGLDRFEGQVLHSMGYKRYRAPPCPFSSQLTLTAKAKARVFQGQGCHDRWDVKLYC